METTSDSPLCRFCFEANDASELISPCDCVGSQSFVHSNCLRRWQMTLLVESAAGGRPSYSERRISHCSVCGSSFRGVETPGRATLIESYCGNNVLSELQCGSFLIASRASSERIVPANLPRMLEALMELKLSHWRRSVYFIYEYSDCGDANGDEKIRALNLTRFQSGSTDQPIPDEVLLDMDSSDLDIRHHNGGPVKWSCHRACVCCLNLPICFLQQQAQQLQLRQHRDVVAGDNVDGDSPDSTSLASALQLLSLLPVRPHTPPSSHNTAIASDTAAPERTLVVGKYAHVISLLRLPAVRDQYAELRDGERTRNADGVASALACTSCDCSSHEGCIGQTSVSGGRMLKLYSFSGYAEWTRAQLLGEIARGSWGVLGSDQAIQICADLVASDSYSHRLDGSEYMPSRLTDENLWERVLPRSVVSGPNSMRDDYERAAATSRLRSTTSKSKAHESFGQSVTRNLNAIATKAPDNVKPYIEKATPVIAQIADVVEKMIPFVILAYNNIVAFYAKISPYHPELLAPAVMGIVMCFFGGSFMTLIAAVEAYRMTGWESTQKCLTDLYKDFQSVHAANKKDDEVDADGDGVPDVQQVTSTDLLTRKTLLFLKTVDPHRFTDALTGLQSGFMAVVAALKVQFAKAITLGVAIAEVLEKPAMRFVEPVLRALLPEEYKKWSVPLVRYTVRSTAVSVAWTIQRIISAFHSALVGGVMATRNIFEYVNIMGIYHGKHEDTYIDEIAGYALSAIGFWFQLSMGFQLPFILSLFLFPFTLAEWFLMYMVLRYSVRKFLIRYDDVQCYASKDKEHAEKCVEVWKDIIERCTEVVLKLINTNTEIIITMSPE